MTCRLHQGESATSRLISAGFRDASNGFLTNIHQELAMTASAKTETPRAQEGG
jgi:hypothetical protein